MAEPKSNRGRKKMDAGKKKTAPGYVVSPETKVAIEDEAKRIKKTPSQVVDTYMPEIIKLKEEKK